MIFFYFACAGTKNNIKTGKEIKVSKDATPDWAPNPPLETFVGISKNFADESSARQDAINDARRQIVDYLGLKIDREIIDRIITQGQTDQILSSDVIGDATTKMLGQTILKVRATKYHIERWQRTEQGKTNYYWKAYCLVPFSESEHHKFAESWISQVSGLAQPVFEDANRLVKSNDLAKAAFKYQKVLKIIKEAEGIADFEPELMKPIKALETHTSLRIADIKSSVLKNQILDGLDDLSRQLPYKPIRVAVGNINYEETLIGSQFSTFLADALNVALAHSNDFNVFERNLDFILKEQSLSQSGIIDKETIVATGKLKGLEAEIKGKYWNEPDQVKINLFLTSAETGRIAATDLILPKIALPDRMEFVPGNLNAAIQTYADFGGKAKLSQSKDFKIRVWVDKGNGGVYTIGEKLLIFFKANHDCFLKLYHTDSAGNILQLFPNQYSRDNFIKAGRVYIIPDESYDFDFVVKLPLGSEIIKAIASLQPFSTKDDFSANEVFKSLGSASKNNIRGILTRDIGIKGKKGVAEDMCVFTTVE